MSWQILEGDCVDVLRELEPESVQTVVTSPPYWGLRDYGDEGQLGLEPTPEQYIENLVTVFREVRRVLRDDGTVWLNLGDSYAGSHGTSTITSEVWASDRRTERHGNARFPPGFKSKDLVGIPWRVAFALQADGWWLRSDIVWAKPNPMPESVTDRPTRSHEYIFLLTKSARYFYDADAIRENLTEATIQRDKSPRGRSQNGGGSDESLSGYDYSREGLGDMQSNATGRNRRSVWTVTTQPFPGAHFATFPPKLIEPCILAGSPPKCCEECGTPWERRLIARSPDGREAEVKGGKAYDADGVPLMGDNMFDHGARGSWNSGGELLERRTAGWQPTCEHDDDSGTAVVLDPFAGAGTTGIVALRHGREFVGVELNPEYAEMARARIRAFEANPNGYLDATEPVPGQLELLGD